MAELYQAMGLYDRAEPLYEEAPVIWRTTLEELHSRVVDGLNNLADLYVATARQVEALDMMAKAAFLDDQMIGQIFSIGSERQCMAYLSILQESSDSLLSLVLQHFPHLRAAQQKGLDLVLRRKAIVAETLAAQRDAILGGRYPDLAHRLQELTILRAQIAQKTLVEPESAGQESRQQLLGEWSAQKEQLEAELARQIPEMKLAKKLQAANRQAVAMALPQMAALVEFVRFAVFDFQAIPA